METIINIEDYKKRQRKHYLKVHSAHIDRFVRHFVATHAPASIDDFVRIHQDIQRNNCQESWDYLELRDIIIESLEKTLGPKLAAELAKQAWYDRRWLSWERVLEHCLAALVTQPHSAEEAVY